MTLGRTTEGGARAMSLHAVGDLSPPAQCRVVSARGQRDRTIGALLCSLAGPQHRSPRSGLAAPSRSGYVLTSRAATRAPAVNTAATMTACTR